ncbi:MAG: ATP-dependent DNA ligase [Microgenomates group bacterium]
MEFSIFSKKLSALEVEQSRLVLTELLAKLYLELENDERQPASYLLQGKLVPAFDSLEFQLSSKMIIRALARLLQSGEAMNLFGESDVSLGLDEVNSLYKNLGDVGLVAEKVRERAPESTKSLSLLEVFSRLEKIARESGAGSQEQKLQKLTALFEELNPVSCRFVARIIIGKLRLGFSVMTLLDALSWAVSGNKSHRDVLEEAYQKQADIGALAAFFLSHPVEELKDESTARKKLSEFTVRAGVPIVPALCQRLNSATEIIEKMGEVLVEPKYDGLRVQIHKTPEGVRAFSRSLEDVSHMFPELTLVGSELRCESCILDAEAIGYDPQTGNLLLFQDTITRKRKHGIKNAAEDVPIRFFAFDVMTIEGKSLINTPLFERKDILRAQFDDSDTLQFTPVTKTSDPIILRQLHDAYLADELEGAVIKKIDSQYRSGRKGWRWVKIKEAEGTSGKLADTLDLVIMGYYRGRGKRAAFGMGAFLVGALNDKEEIRTVAKIGTGISEEQLTSIKKLCDNSSVPEKPPNFYVDKSLIPDVWTAPEIVVEIAADEITRSPNHSAGVALRFPRLRKIRDDKNWTDATTLEEITQLASLE